ncbi:MAG: hypothetical protein AAB011_08390 [Candidatus Eisenbacteria bacterium]
MTRAAHRILNRARSDAWRRVGIPMTWKTSPWAEEGGKNVTGETAGTAGTGRSGDETPKVTDEKDKS